MHTLVSKVTDKLPTSLNMFLFYTSQLQSIKHSHDYTRNQRYGYRVLQTTQMNLVLSCVWADWAVFGSTKTAR